MERKVNISTEALQKTVDIVDKPDERGSSAIKQKLEPKAERCTYCLSEGRARAAWGPGENFR